MSIRDDAVLVKDGPEFSWVEFRDDRGMHYLRIYPVCGVHWNPPYVGSTWILDPSMPTRGGGWRLFTLDGVLGPPHPRHARLPDGFDFEPFLDIAMDLGLQFPDPEASDRWAT